MSYTTPRSNFNYRPGQTLEIARKTRLWAVRTAAATIIVKPEPDAPPAIEPPGIA